MCYPAPPPSYTHTHIHTCFTTPHAVSMHPVESIVYLSKIAGVLFIPAHPLHLLFILFNATLMPIPGHSGHLEALGNEYHWIHHHCFSHNYGSPSVPFDKLFGTHFQFAKAGEKKKV